MAKRCRTLPVTHHPWEGGSRLRPHGGGLEGEACLPLLLLGEMAVAGLGDLAAAILLRLRDPDADFELQALVRGEPDAVWLRRRGARLVLRVIGPGGGEVEWEESAYRSVDPDGAFDALADRIDMVVLHAGGPFPEDLIEVFTPDESGPTVRYRAQWATWEDFKRWLQGGST